ncbi:MAG: hypothetical protein ACM31G_06870, partial [Flavobacteriales bacterium]
DVEVDFTPPGTPGDPAVTPNPNPVPGAPLSISWTPAVDAGALTYTVERSTDGIVWSQLGSVPAEFAIDAPPSGTYHYRVAARDAAGNASLPSGPSAAVIVPV